MDVGSAFAFRFKLGARLKDFVERERTKACAIFSLCTLMVVYMYGWMDVLTLCMYGCTNFLP